MAGFNPNRKSKGSPDGGQFASGDSKRAPQGQVDGVEYDSPGSRKMVSDLATGDRVVIEGRVHEVESTDQDGRSSTIRTTDGDSMVMKSGDRVTVTRMVKAGELTTDDRVMVLGHARAVSSIQQEGNLTVAELHGGESVAFSSDSEVESYERPSPHRVAGHDSSGDAWAEDECLPGDDFEEFTSRLNEGESVLVRYERRGRARRMRGTYFNDNGRPAIEDSMGYSMALDSNNLLSMEVERQLR